MSDSKLYWCPSCQKSSEEDPDDGENEICPHCGSMGLKPMASKQTVNLGPGETPQGPPLA